MMYAVASLLDLESDAFTRKMWDWIQTVCGKADITLSPIPHFSWLIGEELDLDQTKSILEILSKETMPFEIGINGIGIFTGQYPVMYLSLMKSKQMAKLHQTIWDQIPILKSGSGEYYHPDKWIPHITLAYHATDQDRLTCAVQGLVFDFREIRISVQQIGVIYQNENDYGIAMNFNFDGSN